MESAGRKEKLVDAAVRLILRQGYAATTVDQICAYAGVTKGSFFHYFKGKEQICRTAMDAWYAAWEEILRTAKLDEIGDPLARLAGLFRAMEGAYMAPEIDPGCLVGTVGQEMSLPDEQMRETVEGHLAGWVAHTSKLLEEAKRAYPPKTDFNVDEVAWWLCSFVQGTLLIAKVRGREAIVPSNLRHCKAYIEGLFGRPLEGGIQR